MAGDEGFHGEVSKAGQIGERTDRRTPTPWLSLVGEHKRHRGVQIVRYLLLTKPMWHFLKALLRHHHLLRQ